MWDVSEVCLDVSVEELIWKLGWLGMYDVGVMKLGICGYMEVIGMESW